MSSNVAHVSSSGASTRKSFCSFMSPPERRALRNDRRPSFVLHRTKYHRSQPIWIFVRLAHTLARKSHGRDDVLIAGAAAEVSGEHGADLLFAALPELGKQRLE